MSDLLPTAEPITLAAQIGRMASKHPQLRYILRRQMITWEGDWCPSELSDVYRLRVRYHFRRRPVISILRPKLTLAQGQNKLPHVYADGQLDICVHRPAEWNSKLYVADTIMPWISQWIYFYEVWRQTGVWCGKGTHPHLPQHSEVR